MGIDVEDVGDSAEVVDGRRSFATENSEQVPSTETCAVREDGQVDLAALGDLADPGGDPCAELIGLHEMERTRAAVLVRKTRLVFARLNLEKLIQ